MVGCDIDVVEDKSVDKYATKLCVEKVFCMWCVVLNTLFEKIRASEGEPKVKNYFGESLTRAVCTPMTQW